MLMRGLKIAAKVSIDFTGPTRIELLLVSRRCVFDDSLKDHLYSATIQPFDSMTIISVVINHMPFCKVSNAKQKPRGISFDQIHKRNPTDNS